jgi:glycerol-3-phosphate acyltransferase PlsY
MFNLNEGGLWYYLANVKGICTEPWQYALLTVGFALIASLAGYLLGSVNSAIVVSKVFYKDDIRRHGSGNAGLTNILRTYGLKAAGFTLLGDVLKTVLSIFIGAFLGGFCYVGGISIGKVWCDMPMAYIAGFFSIIGHILPIYYGFKGGKGVLCTAAMALVLSPIDFAVLLLLFVIIVAITKMVSLGSITAGFFYPIVIAGHTRLVLGVDNALDGMISLITILIAIIIIYCHRQNIVRISKGTERKLSFGKKPAAAATTADASANDASANDASANDASASNASANDASENGEDK